MAPATVPQTTQTDGILSETTLSLSQAASRLPGTRANNRLHPTTLMRWILRGTRTADGRTVRLEGVRCGNRWVTSVEAISRYVSALTPSTPPEAAAAPRSPSACRRSSSAAAKELEKLGA
jgi:hypothetical protein